MCSLQAESCFSKMLSSDRKKNTTFANDVGVGGLCFLFALVSRLDEAGSGVFKLCMFSLFMSDPFFQISLEKNCDCLALYFLKFFR